MTKIINMTPHEVVLMRSPNEYQTFPSQGVARLVEERIVAGALEDEKAIGCPIQTCYIKYGRIENLPEPQEDVFYIVSALVGPIAAQMGRHDCLSPDSGRAIRENGTIVGVPGFVRY
jgi:hypothetical protein